MSIYRLWVCKSDDTVSGMKMVFFWLSFMFFVSSTLPLLDFCSNSEWIETACGKIKSLIGHSRLLAPAPYSILVSLQKVKTDKADVLKNRFDSLVDDTDNVTARYKSCLASPSIHWSR